MDEFLENIQAQMADVEETLRVLNAALAKPVKGQVEWMGIAGFISNVYMGVENILNNALRAKGTKVVLASASSHRDLLNLAVRRAILSNDLRKALDGYRSLRHVVHHGYGFRLEPHRLEPLALALPDVWGKFRLQMENVFPELRASGT